MKSHGQYLISEYLFIQHAFFDYFFLGSIIALCLIEGIFMTHYHSAIKITTIMVKISLSTFHKCCYVLSPFLIM